MTGPDPKPCPCGSDKDYAACCGLLHAGALAPTPEALMRSRYSAYVVGDVAYLMNTVHPAYRHHHDPAQIAAWSATATWQGRVKKKRLGLTVHRAEQSGATGTVLFSVIYGENGKVRHLQEHSLFERLGDRWYYVQAWSE